MKGKRSDHIFYYNVQKIFNIKQQLNIYPLDNNLGIYSITMCITIQIFNFIKSYGCKICLNIYSRSTFFKVEKMVEMGITGMTV